MALESDDRFRLRIVVCIRAGQERGGPAVVRAKTGGTVCKALPQQERIRGVQNGISDPPRNGCVISPFAKKKSRANHRVTPILDQRSNERGDLVCAMLA